MEPDETEVTSTPAAAAPTPRRGTPERVRSTSRSGGSRRATVPADAPTALAEPVPVAPVPVPVPVAPAPPVVVPPVVAPTNIYRARRPGVAILLVIPAVAVGLLVIRGLAIAGFGHPFDVGGVIGCALVLAALPLLVSGIYGLLTGAAHGAEQFGFKVWARPPLAYLLVGLALIFAAGAALH